MKYEEKLNSKFNSTAIDTLFKLIVPICMRFFNLVQFPEKRVFTASINPFPVLNF